MGIWYKQWYITTPAGAKALRDALDDPETGAETREDCQRRLEELRQINGVGERCALSQGQAVFLAGMLA